MKYIWVVSKLIIIRKATNIHVQVFSEHTFLLSCDKCPQLLGSMIKYAFSYVRNHYTLLQSDYIIFHSHQQHMSDLLAQRSYSIRCAACRGAFTLQRGLSGNVSTLTFRLHGLPLPRRDTRPWNVSQRVRNGFFWFVCLHMYFLFTYVFLFPYLFIFLKNKYFS